MEKLAIFLLLFAFALRLHKVSSVPLSLDEILTIRMCVPFSLSDILTCETRFHPLASALAHLFSPGADHLFLMRWPAVVVGMCSLLLAYRFATDLFGRKVGLLALFLLSISPIHLNYSVVVRGYVGLMATTCASLIFLRRALRHDQWRYWVGFIITNFVGVYFHLYSVLSLGIQLALIGLWYLLRHGALLYRDPNAYWRLLRPRVVKPLTILVLLGLAYAPLVYYLYSYTVEVIQGESLWRDEFWYWRDGVFSFPEDVRPFYDMIAMMGPLSPAGVGTYIYFAFWLIALMVLWYRRQDLALATSVWFVLPFLIIFTAMLTLGPTFLTFTRYLIFILPLYLIVVAVGLEAVLNRLLFWIRTPTMPSVVAGWVGLATLLALWASLAAVSTGWYFQRSTHADWFQVAHLLAERLQPEDVVICEEHRRGIQVPDRAKPYCMWMMATHLPELEAYTPRFQSTTDFVAQYNYLQSERRRVIKPGGVWLVLWQKIILDTSTFYEITAEAPILSSLPDPEVLSPYPVWQFGTTTLVYVNSEDTLLGNIYRATELLLQVEDGPKDKARYYRSLAEMEAVQGRKRQAQQFFEKSWALIEQGGGIYPELFLADTQPVIDRIPDPHGSSENTVSVGYKIGPSLCLRAYEVSPDMLEADHFLKLTLYWQTLDFMDEDYTFFLRLDDWAGQTQGRLEFEPFDRIYPTPWWWTGQQLVERREFHIPADLFGQDYIVKLGAYDRQLPGDEIITPLFLMLYQPDRAEPVRWQVEIMNHSTPNCP